MGAFFFKDKRIAQRLKREALMPAALLPPTDAPYTPIFYFKAPSGGIPAKSGTTWGKATCTLYHGEFDGTDIDEAVAQDTSAADITATVFNWTPVAITGDAFIWCMLYAGTKLVVINEACA